jgi:2-dehydro-3-deoxyphosphooctonate aldolase (KDO 8-P synthase)
METGDLGCKGVFRVRDVEMGGEARLFVIAGPCVIEDERTPIETAFRLKEIGERLQIPLIFKSSYDKANRTSFSSYRGPGMDKGLEILKLIRSETGLPVLSDVHSVQEAQKAASVLDIIQIPAFLCRQTDLVIAAARTGATVNLKKGQFLSPWEMKQAAEKAASTGNRRLILTERGFSFGYNNLVVDMRAIAIMKGFGYPVVFDATHSVQLPGGAGTSSGGQREFVEVLARAAVAAGADGIFLEVHPDPDRALCDGPNSLPLDSLEELLLSLRRIREAVLPGRVRHSQG